MISTQETIAFLSNTVVHDIESALESAESQAEEEYWERELEEVEDAIEFLRTTLIEEKIA